jgi:hypothetical protein
MWNTRFEKHEFLLILQSCSEWTLGLHFWMNLSGLWTHCPTFYNSNVIFHFNSGWYFYVEKHHLISTELTFSPFIIISYEILKFITPNTKGCLWIQSHNYTIYFFTIIPPHNSVTGYRLNNWSLIPRRDRNLSSMPCPNWLWSLFSAQQ